MKNLKREEYLLKKRLPFIKKTLLKKKTINSRYYKKSPIISVCASGGGIRSMLATLGFLKGLKKIGLMNSISYISTVSGSSWAVIPWILNEKNIFECEKKIISNLDAFYQLKNFSKLGFSEIKEKAFLLRQLRNDFLILKKFKQKTNSSFNLMDFYGLFISKITFGSLNEDIINLRLHDLSKKMYGGVFPLPIFPVASQFYLSNYHWLNIDPFFVESDYLKRTICSCDFGKRFYSGVALDNYSNINLSFLLGVFGSAFSGSLRDLFKIIVDLPLSEDLKGLAIKAEKKLSQFEWINKKIYTASVHNFGYGIKDSIAKSINEFSVFDGGYLCNLPLEPLLRRGIKSDIIFILDNTRTLPITTILVQAAKQLKQKGYDFPKIDYEKAAVNNFSVFSDHSTKDFPKVVYIPLIRDDFYNKNFDPHLEKFCGTTNFFYSKNHSELLSGLSCNVVEKNKNKIFDLILRSM